MAGLTLFIIAAYTVGFVGSLILLSLLPTPLTILGMIAAIVVLVRLINTLRL